MRSVTFNATPHKRSVRYLGHEFIQRPKTIKALAKKFMAFRAAQREALEPVDLFCRRGDDAARFAYFD
ncbi:hypothetical protein LB543_05110 [Mesorhizobium sp. ESP7-2]|uniref:hypothetical protein n=1 Tax=Mesorhizobium sp. ESP7-2 TaxID=2876622 RepID=UPI001CCFA5D4|nr:hypothetical protein [Mesorhizobium sp. ESP7-2]MBZ9706098.1 hypothetical protein [Mesorhizobium sp. ESP7-2]